ncbi:unnamed protein product [Danaus chrysippus]|uniref:(African queen) hypothetical protein n=1 Tax=Danaus chrysippus TaxID=151541 RepID=A0A8J2R1I0_9NEOP|nr:unnamed protein product [Danaus chrysippus]
MERSHNLHSSFHGSFRSKESSSTTGSDPREKIKDCLRKFIAFMFTQVGVGALVVCYAILGAASFMHIEKDSPDMQLVKVIKWRQSCVEQLWGITNNNVCRGVNTMLPVRLRRVSGYEGRVNDVIFRPAISDAARGRETLVFFGGDVQDYPEAMQAHRDNRHYVKWNLESTARMLGENFVDKHIVVVRPSRIEFKSFSCYDNFVPSNNAGVPDHTPTHHALIHLERLLKNVSIRMKTMSERELLDVLRDVSAEGGLEGCRPAERQEPSSARDPLWWRESLALDEGSISLVGFSKGCVVLNQIIYEFHYTQTLTPGDEHMMRLSGRISDMYWLDGGHAGGKNTWLTARSLLETIATRGVNIYIHVSPYQIKDESRPWIGREEKIFSSLLKKLGAKVLGLGLEFCGQRSGGGGGTATHTCSPN